MSGTGDIQGATTTAGRGGPAEQSAGTAGAGAAEQPSEAELRAAYEAELSRITSAEMVLQATVSLLNIGARRLGLVVGSEAGASGQPDPERDLEQVRDAIDAVRGLLPIVERRAAEQARPLRDALSQLQMAYARETSAAPASPTQGAPTAQGAPSPPAQPSAPDRPPVASQPGGDQRGPGPAESSGRLWVPGR